jgi:exodeoxyribonuclease V gamma subunit
VLHLHRSERADGIVAMLGELIADPLPDPLRPEVIAVPTRGIERWLAQRLSTLIGVSPGRADGACANVAFPFPGTLVGEAVAAACGIRRHADPWAPERSVWPLLELVEEHLADDWLSPLAVHLERAAPEGEERRFAAVRHVADLFDRYAVHRPALVAAWLEGKDLDTDDSSRWQAELWRRLRRRIGLESPAERLAGACERLRADPSLVDFPERVSLFGLTRFPASYLEVVAALASARDVHLFLLHPSPVLWDRIASEERGPRSAADGALRAGRLRRRDDPTAALAKNPLLASWGQDAREMQLVLQATTTERVDRHRAISAGGAGPGRSAGGAGAGSAVETDRATRAERPGGDRTLLELVQDDVRRDREPLGFPAEGTPDLRPSLDMSDDSIRVHACHGRARQVEVLRDAIYHLLEQTPDLEPRDIVVMCPDIETFAPLIHASFGGGDDSGLDGAGTARSSGGDGEGEAPERASRLTVRLADRSLRQTNPVLSVAAQLLDLAQSRITASEVLDLAAREPVRLRFELDQDDLSRIETWIETSGIRWGLDGEHRKPYKLAALKANSWQAGLDRALLGVTMAGPDERERLFCDVVPLDDVDSGDIDLVGRFAELVGRLGMAIDALSGRKSIADWADALATATSSLASTSVADAWQMVQLRRLLADVVGEATGDEAPSPALLGLADVTTLLGDRLRGRPTRANFRTGHLTICTLVPMRSVPHRVVCLLGLDDGAFPRHTRRDGDDLILAEPYVGDHDTRDEDHQLLLDALLAATDHLVVTYSGRDERTNTTRPPCVPIGELLDVIDRTATIGGELSRRRVVVRHPLQPFDGRNFEVGALIPRGPWSFDHVNLAGARALQAEKKARPPFLLTPLPPLDTSVIELDLLERFVRAPVATFLRQRLNVYLFNDDREVEDKLPVEPDALQKWVVGDRILSALADGVPVEECIAAELARGDLPPGALAEPLLTDLRETAEALIAARSPAPPPEPLDVGIRLDGTAIIGTVAGVRGDLIQSVTFSRLAPAHRLQAWLRLLALSAAHPERAFHTEIIGKGEGGSRNRPRVSKSCAGLGGTPDERRRAANRHLETIVDIFRRGMREPLPIYCRTSHSYAAAERHRENSWSIASHTWADGATNERNEAAHALVLGGRVAFDDIYDEQCRPDERGSEWPAGVTSRFAAYAVRLWGPLLAAEEMSNR